MAGTIATAYVEVLPSTQGITSNLEQAFGGAGEKAGEKGGKLAGASFVGKIGKALAAAGAVKVVTDFFKGAINKGAELQQNIGGTEAVFGKAATDITSRARQAYKNMGLSASDYMATANKMGALFQGSGMKQVESMQLTTKAMQRAADVASVMGLDTSAAMEAIAGAAKGNFTMMDNLGVAMNATTLQAYALEKGINFDWNTASQAEKSRLAMEMFFDRTSQYADNFARESEETISGSLGMLKSSWSDFLANLALGGDVRGTFRNVFKSVLTVGKNILPAIGNVFLGVWDVAKEAGQGIGKSLVGAFGKLKDSIKTNAPGLYNLMSQTWSMISSGAKTAWSGISTVVGDAWSTLQTFWSEHGGQLAEGLGNIWTGIQERWQSALDGLSLFWETWGSTIITAATGLWDTLKVAFQSGLTILTDLFSIFSSAFAGDWAGTWEGIKQLGQDYWQGITDTLWNAWHGITSTAKAAWGVIGPFLSKTWDGIKNTASNIWGKVVGVVSGTWDAIKGGVSGAWEGIKGAVIEAWDNLKSGVTWDSITSSVGEAWSAVEGAVSGAWDAIKAAVQTAWDNVKTVDFASISGKVDEAWSAIEGAVAGAWDAIKQAISDKIEEVKSLLTFDWKLPEIQLPEIPTITVTGVVNWVSGKLGLGGNSGSGGTKWHAKAMDTPFLFSDATLFGAGEAGDEVLYGRAALMRDIQSAVNDGGNSSNAVLSALDRIDQHLDRLGIYLDGETLVGGLAASMNTALGGLDALTQRGLA